MGLGKPLRVGLRLSSGPARAASGGTDRVVGHLATRRRPSRRRPLPNRMFAVQVGGPKPPLANRAAAADGPRDRCRPQAAATASSMPAWASSPLSRTRAPRRPCAPAEAELESARTIAELSGGGAPAGEGDERDRGRDRRVHPAAHRGVQARLHDWPNNLVNMYPWPPDPAVIHAWQLARGAAAPPSSRSPRTRPLQAERAGLPIFSEGLRRLYDGLILFRDDPETPDVAEVDEAVQPARRVRRLRQPSAHLHHVLRREPDRSDRHAGSSDRSTAASASSSPARRSRSSDRPSRATPGRSARPPRRRGLAR